MRRELMNILCCPACKGDLELITSDSSIDIKNGKLYCPRCKYDYMIEDGVPNLFPPYYKAVYER